MSFLRRVLGGSRASSTGTAAGATSAGAGTDGGTGADDSTPGPAADDEAARERDLLRADAERLSHELLARQVRYADRSWTPPAQGGPRRSDDGGAEDD